MTPTEPLEGATALVGRATRARLIAIGGRYGLDGGQLARLRDLLALLAADEHAPTSVRAPERAVDVHLADSLAALEIDALRTAARACDLGAGAGFPGLPLAVALPACRMSLVESTQRKCRFLTRASEDLGITNAVTICTRAEEWVEGRDRHDVALARALAPPAVVLEYAAPLLRRGGTLIDWRGERDAREEARAAAAAEKLGLALSEIRPVEPFPGADRHHLHLYVKVRVTPSDFPRRAGMARKRPLGG